MRRRLVVLFLMLLLTFGGAQVAIPLPPAIPAIPPVTPQQILIYLGGLVLGGIGKYVFDLIVSDDGEVEAESYELEEVEWPFAEVLIEEPPLEFDVAALEADLLWFIHAQAAAKSDTPVAELGDPAALFTEAMVRAYLDDADSMCSPALVHFSGCDDYMSVDDVPGFPYFFGQAGGVNLTSYAESPYRREQIDNWVQVEQYSPVHERYVVTENGIDAEFLEDVSVVFGRAFSGLPDYYYDFSSSWLSEGGFERVNHRGRAYITGSMPADPENYFTAMQPWAHLRLVGFQEARDRASSLSYGYLLNWQQPADPLGVRYCSIPRSPYKGGVYGWDAYDSLEISSMWLRRSCEVNLPAALDDYYGKGYPEGAHFYVRTVSSLITGTETSIPTGSDEYEEFLAGYPPVAYQVHLVPFSTQLDIDWNGNAWLDYSYPSPEFAGGWLNPAFMSISSVVPVVVRYELVDLIEACSGGFSGVLIPCDDGLVINKPLYEVASIESGPGMAYGEFLLPRAELVQGDISGVNYDLAVISFSFTSGQHLSHMTKAYEEWWRGAWFKVATGISAPPVRFEVPVVGDVLPWDVEGAPDFGTATQAGTGHGVWWIVNPVAALQAAFVPSVGFTDRFSLTLDAITARWPFALVESLQVPSTVGEESLALPAISFAGLSMPIDNQWLQARGSLIKVLSTLLLVTGLFVWARGKLTPKAII